jgi:hypothetical protein
MTNYSRDTFNSVYNLSGPCVAAPTSMRVDMLMPVYNLCRNTLYNTRAGV